MQKWNIWMASLAIGGMIASTSGYAGGEKDGEDNGPAGYVPSGNGYVKRPFLIFESLTPENWAAKKDAQQEEAGDFYLSCLSLIKQAEAPFQRSTPQTAEDKASWEAQANLSSRIRWQEEDLAKQTKIQSNLSQILNTLKEKQRPEALSATMDGFVTLCIPKKGGVNVETLSGMIAGSAFFSPAERDYPFHQYTFDPDKNDRLFRAVGGGRIMRGPFAQNIRAQLAETEQKRLEGIEAECQKKAAQLESLKAEMTVFQEIEDIEKRAFEAARAPLLADLPVLNLLKKVSQGYFNFLSRYSNATAADTPDYQDRFAALQQVPALFESLSPDTQEQLRQAANSGTAARARS